MLLPVGFQGCIFRDGSTVSGLDSLRSKRCMRLLRAWPFFRYAQETNESEESHARFYQVKEALQMGLINCLRCFFLLIISAYLHCNFRIGTYKRESYFDTEGGRDNFCRCFLILLVPQLVFFRSKNRYIVLPLEFSGFSQERFGFK